MKKLENKTIFITGGLSGIGKACAIAAAREGGNIAIADLKSDISDSVMAEILKENDAAIFVDCNVSVYEEVKHAVEKAVIKFGTLDVALNNAGISGEPNKVGNMTLDAWQNVIDINLNGVFNCMTHELNHMEKQKKGVIINMSSILGKVGFPMSSHYVAAKHGVIGLTQTAALEYAAMGIRVNAICPGFINTPMLAMAGITKDVDTEQKIIDLHPMKRLGIAEEITKGFIFLASDDSTFITGSTLEIDGGFLAQ